MKQTNHLLAKLINEKLLRLKPAALVCAVILAGIIKYTLNIASPQKLAREGFDKGISMKQHRANAVIALTVSSACWHVSW